VRKLSTFGLFFGLAFLTSLIAAQGGKAIAETLAIAGWQIFWLPVFYLFPLLCATFSWRALFAPWQVPPFRFSLYASWVGLAINWLLPVAQIGGELARVRLLVKRRFPADIAFASVIGDKTLQVITQALYTFVGLMLFLALKQGSVLQNIVHQQRAIAGIAAGIFIMTVASWGFYRVQRLGMFGILTRIAKKFPRVNSTASSSLANLDTAIHAMYDRQKRLVIAAGWRIAFRLVLAGEVWLALYFLGHPVSWIEAIILESLGQGIRTAAFAIPGGLGVQEAGFMVIGTALGLPTPVALALSLSKRVRELVVGVPGAIAWQVTEGIDALRSSEVRS
jgi:putative membrane protein